MSWQVIALGIGVLVIERVDATGKYVIAGAFTVEEVVGYFAAVRAAALGATGDGGVGAAVVPSSPAPPEG